ncbi:PAS domain S-box protein [Sphingomonas jeddahensis]|uniref:histidine kinase n=1 Tax=Sphingomonas jeddahensis TaxID=1915074 RepID=A0A1V2ERN9_9SPHN|nr:PAS domain S-box protein [Sphingomonas jeddahensis]ONF95322.1 Blue-light-activated protein [Sphingomonas jeddahensis]
MAAPVETQTGSHFLRTGGEAGLLIERFDWSTTPLGPIEHWPASLRTITSLVLRSPVPMALLCGPEGVMLYNDRYSEFAGGRHPHLLGTNVREGWPEVADFSDNIMKVCLAGGALSYHDHELTLRRNGRAEQVWMNLDCSPVCDDAGNPLGVLAVVMETTQRVQAEHRQHAAERTAREEEARLRGVLQNMDEAFVLMDRDFRVVDINTVGIHLENRPRDEIIGKTHWEAWPGSEESALGELYKRAMRDHVSVTLDHRYVWPDGHQAWIEARAYPTDDGLACFYRDITERLDAHRALEESEARQRAIIDATPECVKIVAGDGRLLHMNLAGLGMIEADTFDAVCDADTIAIIAPEDRENWRRNHARVLSGERTSWEFDIIGLKGTRRHMETHAVPVTLPDGSVAQLAVTRDLSQRKRTEQDLRRANETLETLNRIGHSLAAELDLERIVQMVTDAGVELTGAKFGAFFYNVHAENGDSFLLYTLSGAARSDFDGFGLPRATEVFKPTFDGDGLIRSHDILEDPRYGKNAPNSGMPPGHLPVRSYLAVPVTSRSGEVIGGLFFGHPDAGVFTERHEQLMTGIAAQAAIAIDNARLYRAAQRELEERARAEEALRVSELRFRQLTELAPAITWFGNPDGSLSYLSPQWYEYTGQSEDSALPLGWAGVIHPDDADRLAAIWEDARKRGVLYELEARLRRHDGVYRWFLIRAHPLQQQDGMISGWLGSDVDIDDQKTAEQALAKLNETLEERVTARTADRDRMWRLSTDVMLVADFEGRIEAVNPAWTTQFGWDERELVGKIFLDLVHPEDLASTIAEVGRLEQGQTTLRFENRYRRKDGTYLWLSWTAVPDDRFIHAVGRNIDAERAAAAELERAQEALRQSQKMEAVGQLTGGVAHDFNNLLTVVTGNIDMAGRALDAAGVSDARARRALDSAMKGAERAAALTQRLLAFSRRQPLAPKPIDVDKLVIGMSDLLNRSLGETVKLEIVTSPGLWRVEADPNQLESAILNLGVNARDAMPKGGELIVETTNARLDEEYSAAHAEVAPGHYVVIAVTDTGEGMPKHVQEKVFEPFFTTKEVGRGTGLGLSMVYGFVKQSGGHVKIYSEEGKGTTVKIYLPRLMSDAPSEAEAHLTAGIETSARAETILVVEDDDDVRAYTVECLRELGYRVLEAHDGPSALRLLERQEDPVDLLFTDVVMPGMSGRELVDTVRDRHGNVRVLYTSGYTRNAIVHGGRLDPGVEMIAKPFTYAALAQKIRDVLDAGRTGRVLVVEHEPTVQALAIEALMAAGYAADEAANGAEALGKVRSAQGRYDVVFLDQDLPDRPGDTIAAELRALHAELPVLITTRTDEDRLVAQLSDDKCTAILGKPYTGAKLAEALRVLGVTCREMP